MWKSPIGVARHGRGNEGADGGGIDGVARLELNVAHVFAGAAQQSGWVGQVRALRKAEVDAVLVAGEVEDHVAHFLAAAIAYRPVAGVEVLGQVGGGGQDHGAGGGRDLADGGGVAGEEFVEAGHGGNRLSLVFSR